MITTILKRPVITEKAARLSALRKYVFVVEYAATKQSVKQAVKAMYNVDVTQVQITTKPGRTRRFRGVPQVRSGYKKAVVTLKEGQKIDFT